MYMHIRRWKWKKLPWECFLQAVKDPLMKNMQQLVQVYISELQSLEGLLLLVSCCEGLESEYYNIFVKNWWNLIKKLFLTLLKPQEEAIKKLKCSIGKIIIMTKYGKLRLERALQKRKFYSTRSVFEMKWLERDIWEGNAYLVELMYSRIWDPA